MNLALDRSIYDQLVEEMPLPPVWSPVPWVPFAEWPLSSEPVAE